MILTPRSSVRDIVWPAIMAGEGAALVAMAFQLSQTEWWSPQDLQAPQRRQRSALLRHARATVPWYRRRFDDAGLTGDAELTPEAWLRVPLLTRQDIREHQAEFESEEVPLEHGKIHRNKTSG